MSTQKYTVNQQLIENLLTWVRSGEIAIPEIQRPFVWEASRVRELMDSLYQGYPTGYLIAWQNPKLKVKDAETRHCCEKVSEFTGEKWQYLKVLDATFRARGASFKSFQELLGVMRK